MHYKWTLHSRTSKQVKHPWFAKLRFFCDFFSTEKNRKIRNILRMKKIRKIRILERSMGRGGHSVVFASDSHVLFCDIFTLSQSAHRRAGTWPSFRCSTVHSLTHTHTHTHTHICLIAVLLHVPLWIVAVVGIALQTAVSARTSQCRVADVPSSH